MRRIINHFTDDDLYKFTMCVAVVDNFPRRCAILSSTATAHTILRASQPKWNDRQPCSRELVITDQEWSSCSGAARIFRHGSMAI